MAERLGLSPIRTSLLKQELIKKFRVNNEYELVKTVKESGGSIEEIAVKKQEINVRFRISFLTQAAVNLAGNEKISAWQPLESPIDSYNEGLLRIDKNALHLSGNHLASASGSIQRSGLRMIFGDIFAPPVGLKPRSETIKFENVEKVIIKTTARGTTFHIYQVREQGAVEVHVFSCHLTDAGKFNDLIAVLKSSIPSQLVKEIS